MGKKQLEHQISNGENGFVIACVIHKIMKIPTGAFSHTGTKTVCIYFTKREGQKTEKIQFSRNE